MMESVTPTPFRRRQINQIRVAPKETKKEFSKVGYSGICPKCHKGFPRGLHLHYRNCKA